MSAVDSRHFIAAVLFVAAVACGEDTPAPTEATADVAAQDARTTDMSTDPPDDPDGADEMDTDEPAVDLTEEPLPESVCDDRLDNDEDGLTDCQDPDCPLECEVCNDLVDNNGDSLTDCADPQCALSEGCPEFCGNEADDDADGAVDCDDPECSEAPRCVEEPTPADDYVFSDQLGYFYRLQYPPDDAPCCFDFNQDDEPDNRLRTILDMIPGYDAQAGMNYQVNKGNVALLLEWVELPDPLDGGGPAGFNLFRAVPVEPEKPYPLPGGQTPEDNLWRDGAGVFQIDRSSFDSRGPRIRFRNATVESPHPHREDAPAFLASVPALMNLTIPIEEIGLDISVNLHGAQIEMDLQATPQDGGPEMISTVSQEGESVTLGGGRLGGYVRADDLLRFLNENAERCACARPADEDPPLLEYGEEVGSGGRVEYRAACRWIPVAPESAFYTCPEEEVVCDYLQEICLAVSAIPLVLDVDSNKNELEDSVSVGLYFDIVSASLADTPFVEE